jgi:PKD repeat protein
MRRLALLLSAAALGCGDDAPALDASVGSDASTGSDAAPTSDAVPSLGWVDYSVSGCIQGAGTESDPCLGPSPLRLRFTVLAPSEVTEQAWDFGDESGSDLANPEHIFSAPGLYTVTLNVAGPGGTAGVSHVESVVVQPAALGSTCAAGDHCESGECTCPAGTCPAPLQTGFCSLSCTDDAECGAGVCVDLDPADVASLPWHGTTCLPACDDSSECPQDFQCQALRGADGAWKSACFADALLHPVGSPCVDGFGALDSSICATGECLDLGDRGMCSAACPAASCPQGSACATFDGGATACLAACSQTACNLDPALACQAPGASGFTVDEVADPAGYCAPQTTP